MHLLELPPEIRETIYAHLLSPANNRLDHDNEYTSYNYRPSLVLFRINRQIYYEARKVFRSLNVFVLIETPWQEAQSHVALDGHVAIITKEERATAFKQHTLTVNIYAPEQGPAMDRMFRFVVLLQDLHKFTTSWQYSYLSHPGLNSHLSLTLTLRDPHTRAAWEDKSISKALQQQLLAPFGRVKDLRELNVGGDPTPYGSLVRDLRTEMAVPEPSPEKCLADATRYKDVGNAELQAQRYMQALECYRKAWLAMHIVVKGRERHIHAEAYFNAVLREEPVKGQNGLTVRMVLRVRLVANTVLVYLKLEQFHEARFWGERTIGFIRQEIGFADGDDLRAEDEAILGFVAAPEMGKIYYRTALACKALDDKSTARKLLRVAQIYLPMDKAVQREVTDCALRLG